MADEQEVTVVEGRRRNALRGDGRGERPLGRLERGRVEHVRELDRQLAERRRGVVVARRRAVEVELGRGEVDLGQVVDRRRTERRLLAAAILELGALLELELVVRLGRLERIDRTEAPLGDARLGERATADIGRVVVDVVVLGRRAETDDLELALVSARALVTPRRGVDLGVELGDEVVEVDRQRGDLVSIRRRDRDDLERSDLELERTALRGRDELAALVADRVLERDGAHARGRDHARIERLDDQRRAERPRHRVTGRRVVAIVRDVDHAVAVDGLALERHRLGVRQRAVERARGLPGVGVLDLHELLDARVEQLVEHHTHVPAIGVRVRDHAGFDRGVVIADLHEREVRQTDAGGAQLVVGSAVGRALGELRARIGADQHGQHLGRPLWSQIGVLLGNPASDENDGCNERPAQMQSHQLGHDQPPNSRQVTNVASASHGLQRRESHRPFLGVTQVAASLRSHQIASRVTRIALLGSPVTRGEFARCDELSSPDGSSNALR